MSRTVVGVLRGGPSPQYDMSLKTGAAILNALPEDQYRALDIYIDKEGRWHHLGRPMEPIRLLHGVDVVVNGLHGAYGEDGTVQRLLERSSVPYTGSTPAASALSLYKPRAKEIVRATGIRVPQGIIFTLPEPRDSLEMARAVFQQFAPPYVIKPAQSGSSLGIMLARTINDLNDKLADALDEHQSVLVEEYIPGQEATVGVIEDFRDHDMYALPPIEIELKNNPFLDYELKCDLSGCIYCPSRFSQPKKNKLEIATRAAHKALGLSHYSKIDFRIHPKRGIYFLEANALPSLAENSFIPRALNEVGSSLKDFLAHIINKALRR